jgi:hypothetical protein
MFSLYQFFHWLVFVASDQEDRFAVWVEREEDANIPAGGSQLLHLVVTACFDPIDGWSSEGRSDFL